MEVSYLGFEYPAMPVKVQPFEHQRRAYSITLEAFYTEKSRGYGLLMQMGCGKSLTAVGITGRLYLDRLIQRVLVVAPLSILGVWEEEFAKFADFDYTLAVLNGTGEKKIKTLHSLDGINLQIAVINYESAWRLEKEIIRWRPDLVIADESHKIKTHNIAASKAMHKIGAKTKYRLLLTGTVVTNKALDIFSQYKYLNPAIFGNSFYAFRNKYFDLTGYGNYTPVLKESMEDELMRRLHSIAFRATKAECLDLPLTTDVIRYVELEPAAMKVYRNLVKDSFAELTNGKLTAPDTGPNTAPNSTPDSAPDTVTVTNILTRMLRLSQLTGGFIGDDEGHAPRSISRAKLDALSDIVEEAVQEDKKLVIIARFVPEIKAIRAMLDKQRINYSLIMGGVANRNEQVARFQTDPDVRIFVGQIATAGLGITLTAASTLVFYSLDYSMSNFEQAKARIHRVGQKENCTYIYLTARSTIDEKILKVLRDKADLARILIDDYRLGRNPFENWPNGKTKECTNGQ